MDEPVAGLYRVLQEECVYLHEILQVLAALPQVIAAGESSRIDFQNVLEKHEVRMATLLREKEEWLLRTAAYFQMPAGRVSCHFLSRMGYPEFEEVGLTAIRLTGQLSQRMIEVSVYLRNFARLHRAFYVLNRQFERSSYSPLGERGGERPANFLREA